MAERKNTAGAGKRRKSAKLIDVDGGEAKPVEDDAD